jgi:hypothetical protein
MPHHEFEYARIMTKEELKQYFNYFITLHQKNKNKAYDFLESVKQQVVDAYYKHEETCIQTHENKIKALYHETICWTEKKCMQCGSKLRQISGEFGQFWGCPKFRDGGQHTRFSLDHDNNLNHKKRYTKIKIGLHWATDLLRSLNYSDSIKASDLLAFFEKCGLEDLRVKYENISSFKAISSYPFAKMQSNKEEDETVNTLRPLFKTVKYQLGIKYKIKGGKENVAVIDLIASTNELVFVIEIKRRPFDINEEQLSLYHQLVSFTLKQQNDTRPCIGAFIVSNPELMISSSWLKTPFALYPHIQSLKGDSNKVIKYLKSRAYIGVSDTGAV